MHVCVCVCGLHTRINGRKEKKEKKMLMFCLLLKIDEQKKR